MSHPGLSLLGFMTEQRALEHFTNECVPPSSDQALLKAEWLTAKQSLGPPTQNAGHPDIQVLSTSLQPHLQQLCAQTWMHALTQSPDFGFAGFGSVEIEPLLAFQFSVDADRSAFHGSGLSRPPALDQMLNVCLPVSPVSEPYTIQKQESSLIVKAKSLNVRLQQHGMFNNGLFGILVAPPPPLVQVSEYNGRYYLTNGFHRAYCLRDAGATHIPCVLRRATSPQMVGIDETGRGTFPLSLLESPDPPTVAHFTQGRAHHVELRSTSRVIHLSWSEWVVADEP